MHFCFVRCTWSVAIVPGEPSVVIDHVFVRGLAGSAERVLTGTVDVSVTTPACGDTPEMTETVTTACRGCRSSVPRRGWAGRCVA